jgi:Replication-relaxation
MPRGKNQTLTEAAAFGLFFIQRYRFLTIDQFARIASLNRSTASEQLLFLERQGFLHHFGNTKLSGHGKTPKVYFLTRKGFVLLVSEADIPAELLGSFKEVKVEAAWSPQMYHRLRTVDVLISLEVAVQKRPHLTILNTFLEYRRIKQGNQIIHETTDFVDAQETADNKIIPDAAFILENNQTGKRALFFLEMDMATERINSLQLRNHKATLHHKFSQYDRYLKSFRYTQKYQAHGEFRSFTMLFVTLQEARIENIRRELLDLPQPLAAYYRLTTFEAALGDFLGTIWQSRLLSDTTSYPLVRDESAVNG